jgi:hypothetical protein
MTDDEYRNQIDAESVAQARSKPWPDRSRVRRVRVEEPGPTGFQRVLAERLTNQRLTEADDGTSR